MVERNREVVEIDGYCPNCKKETLNTAVYVGKLLKQRRCKSCGEVIPSLYKLRMEAYFNELMERLCRKPIEVREEYRGRWLDFLTVLPLKLATKFYREAHYLKDLFGPEEESSEEKESNSSQHVGSSHGN